MKIRYAILCLIALVACAGCATGNFEDKQIFSDSYMTRHGFVSLTFWRLPDGTIRLRTWGEKETPDEFLIAEWQKYAQRLSKGRQFEGIPAIEIYDYTQGYSMLQPYAMGEKRQGKRAEGIIRFVE